ncbi:hypothetical protein BC567DRAFT_78430 [Phyllosticta citribraziliensis]
MTTISNRVQTNSRPTDGEEKQTRWLQKRPPPVLQVAMPRRLVVVAVPAAAIAPSAGHVVVAAARRIPTANQPLPPTSPTKPLRHSNPSAIQKVLVVALACMLGQLLATLAPHTIRPATTYRFILALIHHSIHPSIHPSIQRRPRVSTLTVATAAHTGALGKFSWMVVVGAASLLRGAKTKCPLFADQNRWRCEIGCFASVCSPCRQIR